MVKEVVTGRITPPPNHHPIIAFILAMLQERGWLAFAYGEKLRVIAAMRISHPEVFTEPDDDAIGELIHNIRSGAHNNMSDAVGGAGGEGGGEEKGPTPEKEEGCVCM